MRIAEYFRDQGKNALVILDDLTTHARYYRQISLLIKRFPGRNSYPADIFYAHARLLERAGNFIVGKDGEASITCLAVAETVQGDLSGYIQTNVMSITDGHLYFDIDLFVKGRRPPIHPFLSVTRIGRQTQSSLRQTLNREILSFLSLYEKMQNFTHFGAEVSQTVSATLSSGIKIVSFFDQLSEDIIPLDLQIFLFTLLWASTWQDKEIAVMKDDMQRIITQYNTDPQFQAEIKQMIDASDSFNKMLGAVRGKPEEFYKKLGL
jgi:F0F1-type ATP synthase alpha subunit